MTKEFIKIGLVSISDRASRGEYEDLGLPSLKNWLNSALITPIQFETRLIADEQAEIESTLIDLVDYEACHLILSTGGTGPALRRHARSDTCYCRQANARLWRTNAAN